MEQGYDQFKVCGWGATWQNSGQKSKDDLDDDWRHEGWFTAKPVRGFSENVRPDQDSNHEDGLEFFMKSLNNKDSI